jgi:ERCC4-type nuclease
LWLQESKKSGASSKAIVPSAPAPSKAPRIPQRTDSVVLVIDFRELKRKRGAQLRQALTGLGVQVEERSLALTDMLWVVRKAGAINGDEDLVLRHGYDSFWGILLKITKSWTDMQCGA